MADTSPENLRMLAESVRDYVARGYGVTTRAASLAHPDGCEPARWREFTELGWLALPLAEDLEGLGGSMAEVAVLCEALGRGLVQEPFVAAAVGAAGLFDAATRAGPGAALRGPWGARLAAGQVRLAAGLDEGHTQAAGVHARIAADGQALVQGHVRGIAGGAGADAFLVSARIDGAGPGGDAALCLVARDAPGLEATPRRWFDGSVAVDLQLHAAPAAPVWTGPRSSLDALLAAARLRTRVADAAEAVGWMQGAFDLTRDYVQTRRQFGRSISSNQVVQHRLVDLHVEVCELRALAVATAARIDAASASAAAGDAALGHYATALSALLATTARHVWEECVQLHGAIGMTQENPLAPFVHRLAAAANRRGHADLHFEALGAQALDAAHAPAA